jgi:hypothetical protein
VDLDEWIEVMGKSEKLILVPDISTYLHVTARMIAIVCDGFDTMPKKIARMNEFISSAA